MFRNKFFCIILLLLIVILQSIYLLTLLPNIGWADAPELTTTAYTLGIAHPTGYSMYVLLTHLFARAGPVDSVAWRVNYFSALSATCAMIIFYILLYRHFLTHITQNKYRVLIAATGTLLLAFSNILWTQSVTTKVYSFQLFVFLTIFLLLVEWMRQQDSRFLYLSLFLIGLGFTNHLQTIILAPVLILIFVLKRDYFSGNSKMIFFLISFFLLGYIGVLYLPIRASRYPIMNWGNVQTFQAFLNGISGGQFKLRMFSTAPGMGMQNESMYQGIVMTNLGNFFNALTKQFISQHVQFGIVGIWINVILVLALIFISLWGLLLLWFYDRHLWGSTILVFCTVMGIVTNYHILNIEDYYIPAVAILALWFTFGISKIFIKLLESKLQLELVYSVILLFIACISLFSNYPEIIRSQNKSAYYFGKNILESVENNAVIITGGDNDIFPIWYCKYVLGIKPEVTVFGGNFLTSPWYDSYFKGQKYSFHYQLAQGLYRTQQEWADALNKNVIADNIDNRPVYTTLYDPYIAHQYDYTLIGNFIPDASSLPEAMLLLSSSQLFHLYKQIPDYSVHGETTSYSLNAKFDDTVTLLDCHVNKKEKLHPGDLLNVDYYWKADKEPRTDYTALVVYPDEKGMVTMENGKPSFAQEFQPIHNVFPTSKWTPGMVYKESYKIMIPLLSLNPGKVSMTISLRNGNNFVPALVSMDTVPQNSIPCNILEILP